MMTRVTDDPAVERPSQTLELGLDTFGDITLAPDG